MFRNGGRGNGVAAHAEGRGRDGVRERKLYPVVKRERVRRMRSYTTGEWITETVDDSDWRIEGMPGTYRGYEAALEAFRRYAPANWTLSEDGMTIVQSPRSVEKPMNRPPPGVRRCVRMGARR